MQKDINSLWGLLDIDAMQIRVKAMEKEMQEPNFWQDQESHDYVTWVLFLGCGILNTSNGFGYTRLTEWASKIGKADAICGYASYGIATDYPVVDYVGGEFSDRMKNDQTPQEDLDS